MDMYVARTLHPPNRYDEGCVNSKPQKQVARFYTGESSIYTTWTISEAKFIKCGIVTVNFGEFFWLCLTAHLSSEDVALSLGMHEMAWTSLPHP